MQEANNGKKIEQPECCGVEMEHRANDDYWRCLKCGEIIKLEKEAETP